MSHRIHTDLYRVPKSMIDPGNAGVIRVTEDLAILEMVSAAAETRTLAAPTKPGIRFVIRLMTDGGSIVLTAADGLNADGDTEATFDDASDILALVSVTKSDGSYRWEIESGNSGVSLA